MATVFISYSHQDGQWVTQWLLPRLESSGLKGHIDVRDFTIGKPALLNMENAVLACDYTILVISPNFLKSHWNAFETFMAMIDDPINANKHLLPLLLAPCTLPPHLKQFTYADFTNVTDRELQLTRLLQQLGLTYIPPPIPPTPIHPIAETDISLYRLPVTGDRLFGRENELQQLHEAWADNHTAILSLVAWGGVGKTALVNQWLNEMKQQHYRSAQKVYGWSFYSQGAAAGKQASADEFLQETLTWFGDPHPESGSAVDKGRRLARLVLQHQTLLILDGLEPLQYPPGEISGLEGKVKDPGVVAFLKELATNTQQKPGLCVITTREPLTDLMNRTNFGLTQIPLEHLSSTAGVALLKHLGVSTGLPRDFQEAVLAVEGHALALTLLGLYIKNVYHGDIRCRDKIRHLNQLKKQPGYHALRVMAAYENSYIKYPKWKFLRRFRRFCKTTPELNILYMMGLFDRPVPWGAMEVLLKEPVIPGVTDHLLGVGEEALQMVLSNLREVRLLAAENPRKKDTLDCHPLVREYFGQQLCTLNPQGWQVAHLRLYHYYKNLPKNPLPDTLVEMEPLFAAVSHGCKAGLHEEVRFEVYWQRINRGKEHYCTRKLGAFGVDLAVLSHFFAIPWSQPVAGLPEWGKAVVLSWVAFGLRAMGRLQEAVQPMKAGLELGIQQEDWQGAAIDASNLSELLLTLGDVPGAVAMARQSVSHADRSGEWEQEVGDRITLADALHMSGAKTEAEKWFREAEAKQKQRQPQFSYLYSLQGYQFCDLLLDNPSPAQVQEVIARAEQTLEWVTGKLGILNEALDKLTLGRAWKIVALDKIPMPFSLPHDPLARAKTFLDEAVAGLREAGAQEFLVLGLLARAEYYRLTQEYDNAWDDLNEARDIAEVGGMKLFLCDYHLEAAQLCLALGKKEEAEEHQQEAGKLIEETGYGKKKKTIINDKR